MANINLLPSDLGPKASVLRLAGLLKRVITGGLVIFCVFAVLTSGYILFLDSEVKKISTNSETLKKSIKSLEETEQKLFLVKDRLAKIRSLPGEQALAGGFGSFEPILLGENTRVTFLQVNAAPNKIEVTGSSTSSRVLGDFLEEILVNPDYKTVNLAAFSYNPTAGYLFELGVSTK